MRRGSASRLPRVPERPGYNRPPRTEWLTIPSRPRGPRTPGRGVAMRSAACPTEMTPSKNKRIARAILTRSVVERSPSRDPRRRSRSSSGTSTVFACLEPTCASTPSGDSSAGKFQVGALPWTRRLCGCTLPLAQVSFFLAFGITRRATSWAGYQATPPAATAGRRPPPCRLRSPRSVRRGRRATR